MGERYDTVVVGSGFGGAIVAARLAEAGLRVAVLERGRRWAPGEFPRTTGEVARRGFHREGRAHGVLEYRAFRNVDVIQGVGVGGGSLHYFNVNLRAPERVLRGPRWPDGIDRATLDPYYELVEEMLDARPLTPPAGLGLPSRTTVFRRAAEGAGFEVAATPIAVHTGAARTHPLGGNRQGPCVYCGDCMLGCHVHAKNTLDFTYLGLGERTGRLDVLPLHAAEAIEPLPAGRGYRVRVRVVEEERPDRSVESSIDGERVVVAAGSLGTTELLLRCRDVHRSLPGLGPALGRRFSTNGDMLLAAALGTRDLVDPGRGPSITAMADVSTPDHAMTIEDLGLPDPFFWFLEGLLPPRGSRLRGMVRLAAAYVLRSLGLGTPATRVSSEIDGLLAGGHTAHLLPFLGMGTDAADGVLRLRDGRVDLRWSHRRSRAMFGQLEAALRRVTRETGGRYASLLWRWPVGKLLTAHPLGGCVLGDDPETSVVDARGEVRGHPGLFVTCGAAVPSALAVNPSLTIGALAERAAFHMIHGREMEAGDPARPETPVTGSAG